MIIHKTGDLFTSTAQALGHGVNTQGLMGSGIAPIFRSKFPDIFAPYAKACDDGFLNPGDMIPVFSRGRWIFNIASQKQPGPDARLEWLKAGVEASLAFAAEEGISSIALPRIGAGIGGLNWDDVVDVITEAATAYENITVELWSLPEVS